MPPSVYRISEFVGESAESWDAAAHEAMTTALAKMPGARWGEVVRQEFVFDAHHAATYRTYVSVAYTEQPDSTPF
jgi:dodecin